MAQARLRFTWTLHFDGDHLMAAEVEPDVRRVLAFWVNHPIYRDKFTGLRIDGIALGFMQVQLTVIANDQWRCRQRSGWISRALMSAAHVKYVEVAEPRQERLPPHQHRGARRFEAPKYTEAARG